MTLKDYANLAEILGVIIVVVTLIYLAIQVRQGADLLRSEARQAQITTDQNNIAQFLEHPELGRIMSSQETPSFEEKTQLAFWIVSVMRAREHEWLQYKEGSLDEEAWLSYRGVIYFALGTERARNLWATSAPFFNSGFVEMVEQLIKDSPPIKYWDQMERVL
ncbi:MAG: hypothetical protein HOJ88_03410 [Proteobacteria bacterium]|nr:hypothetical protein [Pseudomonadota bacterium]